MATFETRKTKTGEKRFRATIRLSGFPRKNRTFTTMAKARAWAVKNENGMIDGRAGLSTVGEQHTAGEMIDRYLEKVLPFKPKKRYIRQMRQRLLWWKGQVGSYTLANLTKPIIIEKREMLAGKVKPDTVNCYLSSLSTVLTIAVDDWEWLTVSPMVGVKRMKGFKGRTRYLKDDERPTLLQACRMEKRKPLCLIAVLCIAAGARKEEITALPLKNLDIARGMVETEETKNHEKKAFFFTGLVLEMLREYVEANRSFKRKYLFSNRTGTRPMLIDREFRRARERAGVEDFVFHDLRHTHASYLAMMEGADSKLIADALGQKTVNQATKYTHLSRGHVAKVQASMNEKIFPSTPTPEGEGHAAGS